MKMVTDIFNGKLPMIPDIAIGMIDVRDVARLHAQAMTATGAAGRRFIVASAKPIEMATVAAVLKRAGYFKVPARRAPSSLLRIMGLFDREAKGVLPLLSHRASFDNRSTVDVLGDKWTMLVIRDLIIHGPRTYLELLESLEHTSTDILADRLHLIISINLIERFHP